MGDSTSQPSQAATSGKFTYKLSRATMHSDIHFQLKLTPHLEVLSLQNRIF